MDKALYVAMTGASASLRAQSAVSQNLANVNTVGYKAQLAGTEVFQIPGKGLPTRFDAIPVQPGFDDRAGPLQVTGGDLDIALHEGVWLAVNDAQGGVAYTRAGQLGLTANGLLTTASGLQVLGEGGPVAVPPREKVTIGADGTISIVPQGQGPNTIAQVGRLRLVQPAPDSLERGEDGLFRVKQGAAEPAPAVGVALTQGALEGSNVEAAGALVQMIALQRAFEAQVKVIKNVEENARSTNTLLRLT
ncbi:MAG TPA: flagellar basal body rod protein FlgF [Vicinamibacterales bacterium]|nr:flagellar basal body rod protein FlgF [Vicinamibacterales bacterium]